MDYPTIKFINDIEYILIEEKIQKEFGIIYTIYKYQRKNGKDIKEFISIK